jgi:hypothetical protein
MAGQRNPDPDAIEPQVTSAPEAEVSRMESEDMMAGPGVVAPPGMWRGWVEGGLAGAAIGALVGVVAGVIALAAGASGWWIIAAGAIGLFAGGTIGMILGGSFASLEYDQGGRRAEEDDGGPITRGPHDVARSTRRARPGRIRPSH